MTGHARALSKLSLILLVSLALIPAQCLILLITKGNRAYVIPQVWHSLICRITGIRVRVKGEPVFGKQTLYVSNHLSYLDIPAIGTLLKASFIAKEDVARWPVIGFLARIQQTAFISRKSSNAHTVKNSLDTMVDAGKSLILFPEGTSSPGLNVLPFRSSLFALATPSSASASAPSPNAALLVQPFTINLVGIDGQPPSLAARDLYAWHGDMELAPHIWDFLKHKSAELVLAFHPALTSTGLNPTGADRKTLCTTAQHYVTSGLIGPDKVEITQQQETTL